MPKITHLIVHCSDSTFGNVDIIRHWHKERGFRDIGYHFVCLNGKQKKRDEKIDVLDGAIDAGRTLNFDGEIEGDEVGAHALGMNDESIGFCFIGRGKEDFSAEQLGRGLKWIHHMMDIYNIPLENVLGHYEVPGVTKTCPNMDMGWFRDQLLGFDMGA